ncbi:hypothetical protein DEO72_LG11g2098 [Vigna unguiculata]|uniref:Uncharacterized protein n=1 Tax=Vigna unguiculata TaxID=3917 RepID=A0A4D6NMM9_VIGUN|nr:hypothetical protein DEO72_LG11g2098 [Vigna unguiculata]
MNVKVSESRVHSELAKNEYSAINCRKHSTSLNDFGGVGDRKTSNSFGHMKSIKFLWLNDNELSG